jgi:hypothetical protein
MMLLQQICERFVREFLKVLERILPKQVNRLPGFVVELHTLADHGAPATVILTGKRLLSKTVPRQPPLAVSAPFRSSTGNYAIIFLSRRTVPA